jgi:ketosteroid isomerase-like protein
MRRAGNLLLSLTAMCLLAACATATYDRSVAGHGSSASIAVLENYLAALNRRDLLVLAAHVAPDVKWHSIADGEVIVDARNRQELAALLEQYFKLYPHTRWEIETTLASEAKVAVVERSEWGERQPFESKMSMSVYEIEDGRIKRITQFID